MSGTYQAVDCQGFAGGFTLGAVQAGLELVQKYEQPGGFGVANCDRNRQLLGEDWGVQVASPEEWEPMQVPVTFGNPPCSGFSLLSASDFRGADSSINSCMWAFAELAAHNGSEIAVFESVQQAFTSGHELMRGLRDRVEEITGRRYHLTHVKHNGVAHGGPAMRRRYFWVVSTVPFGVEHEVPDRLPNFMETIGDLQGLKSQWEPQRYKRKPSFWAEPLRRDDGLVDGHIWLETPAIRRALALRTGPNGEDHPWQPGDNIQRVAQSYYERFGQLPPMWVEGGQDVTVLKKVEEKGWDRTFGFYQHHMWKPENFARVVTGAGLELIMHPTEPRYYTHREVARLQGFPDSWLIEPLADVSNLRMTWGKGIPVQAGKWISEWVIRALDGEPGSDRGETIGDRESLIDTTNDWKLVPEDRRPKR